MRIDTTTDLKGLRLLLGLSPSDAAALIGESKDWLVDAERGRSWSISPKYRDVLLSFGEAAADLAETIFASSDAFVIVYPNDDVYRDREPLWSRRLPTAGMHLHACMRAKAALEEGFCSRRDPPTVTLVTLFPRSLEEYLAHTGQADSPDVRQAWAAAYVKNYRVMEAKDA